MTVWHIVWLCVGFSAQAIFASRFLVQWIVSERKGRSIVPIQFWTLSLAGGCMLLAYAIHLRDPVFIVGQGFGLVVYSRNLVLIRREKRATELSAEAAAKTETPRD